MRLRLWAAAGAVLVIAGQGSSADARRDAKPASVAPAMTMQLGKRLGPYVIGATRRQFHGLVRTVRKPENDGYGCSGTFRRDSYIDVYEGVRLGYLRFGRRTYLDTIATTRSGDRTAVGLTIGRSTRAAVRRRYPGLRVAVHRGGSAITLHRRTGYEAFAYITFTFDAARRLVGLETGVGGC